jgi:anti-anti-sigma factor
MGICEAHREIDLVTAPTFAAAICAETDCAPNRAVLIDCSAITFMDSSAFHALVYAHAYALERGHRLVIRNLNPNCTQVIDLCDWNHELTIANIETDPGRPPITLDRNDRSINRH